MKANLKSLAVGLGLLGTAALALAQTAAPEAAATVAQAGSACTGVAWLSDRQASNCARTGWAPSSTRPSIGNRIHRGTGSTLPNASVTRTQKLRACVMAGVVKVLAVASATGDDVSPEKPEYH